MEIVFEASCNSDRVEGRGHKEVIGYFKSKIDAEALNERAEYHGMGVINPQYRAVSVSAVRVYDNIEDFDANKPELIRQKALAKLTDIEKEALGLL